MDMVRWRRLVPLIFLILAAVIGPLAVVTPRVAQATHKSTACKWGFPWPRTIYYYVNTGVGQFSSDHATRVQYGGNTWTETGFNLLFQRTTNRDAATNYSEHFKGSASSTTVAWARVSPSTSCNVDAGFSCTFAPASR